MKRNLLFAAVFCVAAVAVSTALGQDPKIVAAAGDRYVISAKAGGVNYVAGNVSVARTSGTSGYLLAGDELEIGDRVTTSAGAMAEILLNPGSYVRLGGNSTFEFGTTSLDDLKVMLRTGSAVFEVIAADDFKVSVQTPRSEIDLTRSGVYRIDVIGDGAVRLSVFKGKAYVGAGDGVEIPAGRATVLARGGVSITKFDRDQGDELDRWSKDRARELTRVNARLQRNSLRDTLLSSYNMRGWNMYNSFGLWVFDPVRRMWCFLPFGYGWGSPYGWDYGFDIWRCRLPWWVYRDWYPSGGGTTGGGGNPPVRPNEERRSRMHTPPFQRVEESERSTRGSTILRRTEIDTGGSRPSSSPPVSSPPIIVAPAPPSETKGKP